MPDQDSSLFSDPDKIVSDLNQFARFPVDGLIANLAAVKAAQILKGELVGIDPDGKPRPPRIRDINAAIRAVISMVKINQAERDAVAGLRGDRDRISKAMQLLLDMNAASTQQGAHHDLLTRTALEARALLDSLEGGPEPDRDSPSAGEDHVGPGRDGGTGPVEPA